MSRSSLIQTNTPPPISAQIVQIYRDEESRIPTLTERVHVPKRPQQKRNKCPHREEECSAFEQCPLARSDAKIDCKPLGVYVKNAVVEFIKDVYLSIYYFLSDFIFIDHVYLLVQNDIKKLIVEEITATIIFWNVMLGTLTVMAFIPSIWSSWISIISWILLLTSSVAAFYIRADRLMTFTYPFIRYEVKHKALLPFVFPRLLYKAMHSI